MRPASLSLLLLAVSLAALAPCASGALIEDPENVTYMKVSMIQSGHIRLVPLSSAASAEKLRVAIYVPQNDSRQRSSVARVIGPGEYSMEQDGFGNTMIVMEWERPRLDANNDYLVETVSEVTDSPVTEARDFVETALVAPTPGIMEAANMLAAGEATPEAALRTAAWINSNIAYDISFDEATLPAGWVFREKRGTCDEFSNLLVSMLRVAGFRAWYVAGYAYLGGKDSGASSFGAHAWTEAVADGKTYSIDATWSESPVDATHLAVARLPDSNFTERTEVKSRDVRIEWEKAETRLSILGTREGPRIAISLEAVPGSVPGGKSALILARAEAGGCILTKAYLGSCVNQDGSQLLGIEEKEKPVYFCGSKTMHWTASVPSLPSRYVYTCPLSVRAGGAVSGARLSVGSAADPGLSMSLSVRKALMPGEQVTETAELRNLGRSPLSLRVFGILGDDIEEKAASLAGRESDALEFGLTAPLMTGGYEASVFASTGDLASDVITVVDERQARITEISVPARLRLGETGNITVTISNSGGAFDAVIRLQSGNLTLSRSVQMGANSTATGGFSFAASEAGYRGITVALFGADGKYQDGWTGSLEVFRDKDLVETIAGQVEDFFFWLAGVIRGLLGI